MTDETVPSESPVDETLPVTPAAQAPEPETAPEPTQEPDDAGSAEDKPKGGFQRRIKEVIDDRNYWRDMAMRTTQPSSQQPTPKPEPAQQPERLPTLEEHGYDEAKYQAALIEFADKRAQATVEKRFAEYERQRSEQARVESFAIRQADFAKSNPDFEEKVMRDPTLPITEGMRDVIIDSPSGPELAYWLATNRAEAEKIARLPTHLAALEMGRIEGRLEAQKAAKVAPKPKPVVSNAPPPPPQVETASTSLPIKASTADSDQLSDSEWMRLRDKELKHKKG